MSILDPISNVLLTVALDEKFEKHWPKVNPEVGEEFTGVTFEWGQLGHMPDLMGNCEE